jgi:hypothetical protein
MTSICKIKYKNTSHKENYASACNATIKYLFNYAVVDMLLAGWCSWTFGMSPKVECSEPSAMVERIWVGGWF